MAGDLMRDEGIGVRFEADLAPLIKANELTDKLVDKWAIVNKQLAKTGDTTDLSRGMAQANTEIKRTGDLADRNYSQMNRSINQSIDSVNRLGDATKRTGNEGSNSLNIAAKHTTLLGRAADSTKDKISGMWNKTTNSEATQKTSDNLNKIDEHLSRVGNSANKSGNKVSESQRRTRSETDKTTTSFGRLKDAGSRLTNMGNTIAMAMIPVAAAFKKSADEATELENRYKTIQNLLHTGGESASASKAQSRAMEKENNNFALQYGVSPTAMAKGGEELIRRGYSGNQELASHKYFLQAARASGDPYSAVVNYGAPALEQFGYKTKAGESQKKMAAYTKMVLNQMAYGADLSATDFSGMGESLKYAGATAKSGNQSLAGTISDIGVLSNNGQDGSVAGTGLRKVINSLLAPSSGMMGQGVSALKSIGLTPDDLRSSKGNLKSLDDEFELLNQHMKGMTGTQKATLFHQLFGATGQESALILSNNVKQMKSLNAQVEKAPKYGKGGYIQDLAQKNMSSWQNQIDVFKQHLNVMGLDFTKTVLPGFTKLLSTGNKFLNTLIKMPAPVKEVAGYTTAIASGLGTAYAGSRILKKSISWLNSDSNSSVPNTKQPVNSNGNVPVNTDVPEIGSRSGAVHYSGIRGGVRNWMDNSKLGGVAKSYGYLQLGIQGVQAINNASTIFTKGITSSQGSKAAWQTGGQLVGGGIGAFLGGPAGAGIGAQIGGAIGKAFGSSKYVKNIEHGGSINPTDNSRTTPGNAGAALSGGDAAVAANSLGDRQARAAYRAKHGKTNVRDSGRGSAYQTTSVKSAVNSWGYASLSKANASYIKKAVNLEQQGNIAWADSAGKTSNKVKSIYGKLAQLANNQGKQEISASQKRLDYLKKNHIISNATAASEYAADKNSVQKRLAYLHTGLNKIDSDENLSASKRAKLINSVNRQIVSLTDKGARKQEAIMRGLMSSTTHLTTSGYAKILTSSKKNEEKTIANARKTYNAEVSASDKRYKKEVSTAKAEYGVNSNRYKNAVKAAEKQRAGTIANAKQQYKSTTTYAEKQRKNIVEAARKEAGAAVNAFSKAAKDIGNSIPALITSNIKAGLQTKQSKFNSGDFTDNIAKNYGKNNAGTTTTKGRRPKSYKGPYNPTNDLSKYSSYATGGKITHAQTALVGEGGLELAYTVRGRKARLLGVNGPQLAHLKPGEHILNAQATKRVLSGSYGQSLPGYANGTTGLGTSKANGSIDKFNKKSKRIWDKTYSDTSRSTKKIKKNTIDDYDATQKGSVSQLSQLSKQNRHQWSNIYNKTGDYTNNIRKSSVKDFDSMQKGVQGQMNQVRKGVTNAADDTATGFGHALGRMDNYAHKAMSNTINQLNNGIKGIDKSLGQFGGNNSVINPIHYAQGSNGQLSEDQIAMVNDAESGPRQEGIIRGNSLYAPQGRNRVIGLKRGDAVLNGTQMQRLSQARGITHYAKGSGVSNAFLKKLISSSAKDPSGWLKKNMTVNIKLHGTDLSKGATNTAKGAYGKYGNPWADEVWKQMKDARSGGAGGVGGNWRHTPGLAESNGFNARRGNGIHDGVDFSGAAGSSIRAVHGGTVTRTGASDPWNDYKDLGSIITVKSDDGYQEIYQEFGTNKNIRVHTGDQIKTGQAIATLGHLAGHEMHVHVGVSKGSLWNHGGYSHNGWFDVTKMHGHSNGNKKANTKHSSALSKLVAKEIAPQLKWVGKHLEDSNVEAGGAGNIGGAGVNRWIPLIKKGAKAMHVDLTSDRLKRVLNTMTHESQGDPTVWQHGYTDINTNRDPARGLFQFIGTTFKRYALKGHTNRANGYDQILALFNDSNLWSDLRWNGGWAPSGNRRFAKGGIPQTNKASIVGEKGAELFMPNVSGRVFTAKDTAVMATNMMKASLSVGKMLRELERVIKKPAVSAASYRHVAKTEPTFHIETHDKFEFNIGTGVELNERTITKMIKNALKRERQNMARQIIDQFGGTK
ncbi:phage tail tape measure protein [Lentilactobacillus parabuchneri]|uniref:phage tail tape measure protein n=1 Tax=Lentilactobacillus parabuchneri TaxID=152331 RepID=UPI00230827CE|nr:phage tail tape measure protein [Lentilactobacillus parabuchneri]MDB1102400.1 phage tail tape measure protein [Lentilactobacillus parabuchneri]